MATMLLHRLNWGCGPIRPAGWVNSDREPGEGVDLVCDIRDGLPVPDDTFDCIVSIHVLEQIPYLELDAALTELRRVLKPDGVMRLGVPDLDCAIVAYLRGQPDYFHVADHEVASIGGKLCVQMTWYGSTRSLFTYDFLAELLARTGFRDIRRCAFRATGSRDLSIVELDNRERESLFVEAIK
jgi:predicted SAM-dependent methyltransferase